MDLIDRQAAIKTLEKGLPSEPLKSKYTEGITVGFGLAITWIEQLPAVPTCEDTVSRQQAIDALMARDKELRNINWYDKPYAEGECRGIDEALAIVSNLPSAQPDHRGSFAQGQEDDLVKDSGGLVKDLVNDCISRQAAIDALSQYPFEKVVNCVSIIEELPSAQPEQRCVNCGRTANNGGWYEDGGTRCPIEEHYTLPNDGYCHLWEKRNVSDDDYPERREG